MRPQHAHEAFGQFGQLVVELVAQTPHQECTSFEEPLDMRITLAYTVKIQFARAVRKCLREFLSRFAQVPHFRLVGIARPHRMVP